MASRICKDTLKKQAIKHDILFAPVRRKPQRRGKRKHPRESSAHPLRLTSTVSDTTTETKPDIKQQWPSRITVISLLQTPVKEEVRTDNLKRLRYVKDSSSSEPDSEDDSPLFQRPGVRLSPIMEQKHCDTQLPHLNEVVPPIILPPPVQRLYTTAEYFRMILS